MPLRIPSGAPTLLIRRSAYERAAFVRSAIDALLGATPDEFRVEGDLVAIGPVYAEEAFAELMKQCEARGLEYYEDFFELTGNWPAWVALLASADAPGRNSPSQPQR